MSPVLCHTLNCCHNFRPQSKMNAAGRNVFMREAVFIHQKARLFDVKHDIWQLSSHVMSQQKTIFFFFFAPHINEALINSFIVVLLVCDTDSNLNIT